MLFTSWLVLAVGAAATNSGDAFVSQCNDFVNHIHIKNITVTDAAYVAAGSNVTIAGTPVDCGPPFAIVPSDICRVAMKAATGKNGTVRFELWLPRNYSSRFFSAGNGGLGGCISYSDLAWASSLGFAAVGGNNGHDGNSAAPLLNNPDAVEDFAWRSLYTAAIHGQALTKQFYKNGYKKAYYSGCSTGGRQGWKLAQSFPDLFDGILTGAPALYFSNLLSWIVHYYPLTGPPGSATFVTAPQWGAVQDLVYRQCDTIDGAKDGILEDPSRCHPVLDSLKCSASNSNTTTCLTPTQFKTVLASYFSYQGTHGQILSPSIEPGVEAEEPNNFYNGQPYYSADWWKYAIYNNPDWDPITFTPRDAEYAIAKNPGDIQTSNANLGPFQKHGGKVLGYHGQADTVVTPYISTKYYDAVSATMKLNPHQLDDFFRLFRIGGMNHCGGGNGPTAIGNSQQSSTDYSPENNVLMALVRWVEHDVPPEFVRGKSVTFDGTVAYSRKHCRYPKHNIHFGSKEYTDENSWKCID